MESVERSKRRRSSVDNVRSGRPSAAAAVGVKVQIVQLWKEAVQDVVRPSRSHFVLIESGNLYNVRSYVGLLSKRQLRRKLICD